MGEEGRRRGGEWKGVMGETTPDLEPECEDALS